MRNLSRFVLAAILFVASTSARADDWPQWRGPDRTGISPEKGLLKTWPSSGPALAWTFDNAGMGFSSPAIVGGRVYCAGARGDEEVAFALDANGKELWKAKIGPVYDFKSNVWSRGPIATPTVDGPLVYALGSQGDLVCLETKTGNEVWRKSLPKDLAGEVNNVTGGDDQAKLGWGYAWSPIVDGDKLICTPGGPGGLFAALDKKTGAVLWRSGDVKDAATYSSPVVADIAGVRQYITLVQNGVVAVSAANGALLWENRRGSDYSDVVCPTPIVHGDYVYTSVGYNGGSTLLKIEKDGSKFKAVPVYTKKDIASRQGGVVLYNGALFGAQEANGWECQDLATGAQKWLARRGVGIGPFIEADGRLYIVSEQKGEVAMVDASPAAFKQLSKFNLPQQSKLRKTNGRIWTQPVISDGKLYIRDQELIFCYKIK